MGVILFWSSATLATKVVHILLPESAQFGTSAFPQFQRNQGSNFPVSGLAFDASSDEQCFWRWYAHQYGASSPNLTIDVYWYADTASSGDVVWATQFSALTANTDTQDIETDGLDTADSVTDSHLGTTGQRLHSAQISPSNTDSLAAGDIVHMKLFRDADNGSDTMSGDAVVIAVVVTYEIA